MLIDGEDIVPMNERDLIRVRRRFGMLFQGAALFDSMTVAENVGFAFRQNEKLTHTEIAQKVAETLEMVDLPGTEEKKPAELSGGMRKRVGLARAIIYQPEIVLYDEPTTGLDPIVADSIDQLILRVRDRLKVTTVVVTHDMRSARRLGQRILMLHNKKIYANGLPDEFFGSQDPVIRRFIDGVSDPKEVFFRYGKNAFRGKSRPVRFRGAGVAGAVAHPVQQRHDVFRGTYEIRLHAVNVGGLKPRAAVLLAGVQVGSVSDIQLAADTKSVTIFLENLQTLTRSTATRDLSSNNPVSWATNTCPSFPRITAAKSSKMARMSPARSPFNLQEVARSASGFIQRIDETAKKLDAAVSDVRRLVLNEQTLTNLSATIDNMRTASQRALTAMDNVNALVNSNTSPIAASVSNVVFFSQEINRLAGTADQLLATNGPDISAAVKNIESSTVVLKSLLDDLQAGKGLAGSLLKNESLATNIDVIANNLAITSSNLNRLGLWGILWKRHEPATNESSSNPVAAPHNPFR